VPAGDSWPEHGNPLAPPHCQKTIGSLEIRVCSRGQKLASEEVMQSRRTFLILDACTLAVALSAGGCPGSFEKESPRPDTNMVTYSKPFDAGMTDGLTAKSDQRHDQRAADHRSPDHRSPDHRSSDTKIPGSCPCTDSNQVCVNGMCRTKCSCSGNCSADCTCKAGEACVTATAISTDICVEAVGLGSPCTDNGPFCQNHLVCYNGTCVAQCPTGSCSTAGASCMYTANYCFFCSK
jgi:hypothetical protein